MHTYMHKSKCLHSAEKLAQRLFLREVLPLAKMHDLTLVLHCRDDGDGTAASEVLNLLKETKLIELWIQRHCFTVDEMHDCLYALPNVMFSLTSQSLTYPHILEVLSKLELGKIVLETDSPYLKMSVWVTDSSGVKTFGFSPCDVYLLMCILWLTNTSDCFIFWERSMTDFTYFSQTPYIQILNLKCRKVLKSFHFWI